MTEPVPDPRLWRVHWVTLNGQHRAATYCTEHKRRHESACATVHLPRPTSTLATSPAARCRQCQGPGRAGRRGVPIFDRAPRGAVA